MGAILSDRAAVLPVANGRRTAMARITVSGASTPSAVMNVACSIPSMLGAARA